MLTAKFGTQADSQISEPVNDLMGLVGQEAVCAAVTMESLGYACPQVCPRNLYIQQQTDPAW